MSLFGDPLLRPKPNGRFLQALLAAPAGIAPARCGQEKSRPEAACSFSDQAGSGGGCLCLGRKSLHDRPVDIDQRFEIVLAPHDEGGVLVHKQ